MGVDDVVNTREHSFRKYISRRIHRIAPAYYVSIAVVLAVYAGTKPLPTSAIEGSLGFWNLGSVLLFVQNYVPAGRIAKLQRPEQPLVDLFHVPILAWLSQRITPTNPLRTLALYASITLVLSVLSGTLSWLVIERAFLVRHPRPKWTPKAIAAVIAAALVGTYAWVATTRPDPLVLTASYSPDK
ncbi:MAG: hypothetical protein LLG14_01305 [Nocardiaceae bacterium]|nr:hypothetical protein [Nocardiaceae bacterium]